jgi:hypothetical protein
VGGSHPAAALQLAGLPFALLDHLILRRAHLDARLVVLLRDHGLVATTTTGSGTGSDGLAIFALSLRASSSTSSYSPERSCRGGAASPSPDVELLKVGADRQSATTGSWLGLDGKVLAESPPDGFTHCVYDQRNSSRLFATPAGNGEGDGPSMEVWVRLHRRQPLTRPGPRIRPPNRRIYAVWPMVFDSQFHINDLVDSTTPAEPTTVPVSRRNSFA